MRTFLATLRQNAAALPANVRQELHSGGDAVDPARRMRRSFFDHLHPIRVTEHALDPRATLGLGVASVTLAVLLTITGVLLMVYYVPTTTDAHGSMQDLQYAVAFGGFLRALHRWTAHGMVATVCLHLVRVAAMGAYRGRALNWLFGMVLLLATLGLAFTGYLLPWDQLSYWAVTVAASMLDNVPVLGGFCKRLALGGDTVGQPTLTRFYTLHVALLPILLAAIGALHLWRVRKDGGLAGGGEATVPAWPHLVQRELAVALAVTAAFSFASLLFSAPLGPPPDLHAPSNPEKAPWYFLWVQEMVSYSAPVGGVLFPLVFIGSLLLLPLFDPEDEATGRWFSPGRTREAVLSSLGAAIAGFVALQAAFLDRPLPASTLGRDVLNPATGMLLIALLAFLIAGWATHSTKAAFLSALAVFAVAVVGFTLVGLCRGPNWLFHWPWEAWPIVS